VTVNVFAVHCAYNVKFAVWPCVYGKETADPPDDAANHPANVYPARVGVPGDDAICPPVVVEPLLIAEPLCESYVTVNVSAVQTAYNVVSAVIENVLATARAVPVHTEPAAGCVVHQPANV